jgi:hypothetical protein
MVSPLKSCNFSIVSILRATTELSSFTASSTMRRFGDFFRSRIAVEKSLLDAPAFLQDENQYSEPSQQSGT